MVSDNIQYFNLKYSMVQMSVKDDDAAWTMALAARCIIRALASRVRIPRLSSGTRCSFF